MWQHAAWSGLLHTIGATERCVWRSGGMMITRENRRKSVINLAQSFTVNLSWSCPGLNLRLCSENLACRCLSDGIGPSWSHVCVKCFCPRYCTISANLEVCNYIFLFLLWYFSFVLLHVFELLALCWCISCQRPSGTESETEEEVLAAVKHLILPNIQISLDEFLNEWVALSHLLAVLLCPNIRLILYRVTNVYR